MKKLYRKIVEREPLQMAESFSPLTQAWSSLNVKARYWQGSPWRAFRALAR